MDSIVSTFFQETCQSNQMQGKVQKGMFEAFHILKKIADNLNEPVEKYGKPLSLCNHGYDTKKFSVDQLQKSNIFCQPFD